MIRDSALFHVALRSQVFIEEDDATMATKWDEEMTDRFDQLQQALTDEIRKQFVTLGGELEERLGDRLEQRLETQGERLEARLEQRLGDRLEQRLETQGERLEERLEKRLGERLEERIDKRLAESEERLTAHISQTIQVQGESLRDIVKTAGENYGGVLGRIDRELGEFRKEWRAQTEDTTAVLANHNERLRVLEATGGNRG